MLTEAVAPSDGGDSIPVALLLVSPLADSIFAVVELDPVNSDVTDPNNVSLAFRFVGGSHTDRLPGPHGKRRFPARPDLRWPSSAVLEEYRYYVREERAIPGDDTSELRPLPVASSHVSRDRGPLRR